MVERRFLKTLGTILAAIALVWVLAAFGLGVLLPFLLGYLAARLAEPLVRRLSAHGRLPRWACSGLCVSGVLLVLGLLLYGLGPGAVFRSRRLLPAGATAAAVAGGADAAAAAPG